MKQYSTKTSIAHAHPLTCTKDVAFDRLECCGRYWNGVTGERDQEVVFPQHGSLALKFTHGDSSRALPKRETHNY